MFVSSLPKHFQGSCGRSDTGETKKAIDELNATPGNKIEATTDPTQIKHADFVIIAVPTPVTKAKDPDLGAGEICVKDRRAEPEEWCHRGPEVHVLSRGNRRDHGANH